MAANPSLTEKHNFLNEASFRFKVIALVLRRFLKDSVINRSSRFKNNNSLIKAPVIATSESELWNADDNDNNRILTAGKIENLRVAACKLNGIEVKAGEVFSFWKHIGPPLKHQGFVVGREIREGCIVPTIAGGLCQLSNALYDAALKAGFEIIERHKHTQVIKGSLAEQGRDATVKWNYVDLRFRSASSFKIVIDFTLDKLIVQFKSYQESTFSNTEKLNSSIQFSKLNDCYSCGNVSCFKHPGDIKPIAQKQITTFILDEKWPEHENYIDTIITDNDYFIVPFAKKSRFSIARYVWNVSPKRLAGNFSITALRRAISIRRAAKSNGNIPAQYLKYDSAIVNKIKNSIPIESTHIVIAQNLLPFAWQQGILWGRTFDVLMSRLPIEILQQKLDHAHAKYPGSKTLNDFRADEALMNMENAALTKARHIITPHQQIASIFTHKAIKLDWVMPSMQEKNRAAGNKILFPASALARKGAYEMKRLAQELNFQLVVTGNAVESDSFWDNVNVVKATGNIFEEINLVVLPSYVEHQPRLLLKAITLGIPVIASTACGLAARENLTVIPESDYAALKKAVQEVYLAKQAEQVYSF